MSVATEPESRPNNKVFVSYAHEDRAHLEDLRTFLTPAVRDDRLRLLDDTQIPIGEPWQEVIEGWLEDAAVCVLLVSQDFLASDFIADYELPAILDRVERNETRLFWVAVNHSTVGDSPLAAFQSANDPSRPIAELSEAEQASTWAGIARQVAGATTLNSVARSLTFLDETAESFEAAAQQRDVRVEHVHAVSVEQLDRQSDTIRFAGATETISYEDLSRLPPEDHEYIQDHEAALSKHYRLWKRVKSRIGDAGGVMDEELRDELQRIAELICADLNAILDFLLQIHHYELEDHYGRYRHICGQLTSSQSLS